MFIESSRAVGDAGGWDGDVCISPLAPGGGVAGALSNTAFTCLINSSAAAQFVERSLLEGC